MCVLWKENPFCGMFCRFLTRYMYVFVCLFFILLYINSKACVDIVYICLFDMKNNLMARLKSTLHICNMHRCTIEDSVCVCSCCPPGLPPSYGS